MLGRTDLESIKFGKTKLDELAKGGTTKLAGDVKVLVQPAAATGPASGRDRVDEKSMR